MKKFTNISNTTVGQPVEIKIDEKQLKIDEFKHQVMKLMDDFLVVRSFGVARPEILIPTKIVGKELFIEALQDLLSSQENKKMIQVLESLKNKTHDWQAIDEKIIELSTKPRDLKREIKIKEKIEKWSDDSLIFEICVKTYKNKLSEKEIEKIDQCLDRMIVIESDTSMKDKLKMFKDYFY